MATEQTFDANTLEYRMTLSRYLLSFHPVLLLLSLLYLNFQSLPSSSLATYLYAAMVSIALFPLIVLHSATQDALFSNKAPFLFTPRTLPDVSALFYASISFVALFFTTLIAPFFCLYWAINQPAFLPSFWHHSPLLLFILLSMTHILVSTIRHTRLD